MRPSHRRARRLERWVNFFVFVAVAFAAAFAGAFPTACRREDKPSGVSGPETPLARGDFVVVEPEAARFFEARVLAVEASHLRVQRVEGGDTTTVASADAYRLPPALEPHADGELAICRARETRWIGCRIEHGSATSIVAHDADGARLELTPSQVLSPNPVTELNLRRHFERANRRSEFQRAVAGAGSPSAPPSWRPALRDRVVVRDETGWYSAIVQEIEDDGISVAWKADQQVTKVLRTSIVPEPPNVQPLRGGQMALLRPDGPAQPWRPVRIESARGGVLTVIDVNEQRRSPAARDLLVLVAADAG